MTRQAWIATRVALCALALSACGGGGGSPAVEACRKAVDERLAGQSYELDLADMVANLKNRDDGTQEIVSTVVFDKGLPKEKKQSFDCRLQVDPAKPGEPAVIGLNFVW